jgi:hypothetical protein
VAASVFAMALTASAQGTKVSGKAHCDKPDPGASTDVGDKPGHMMMIRGAACKYTTPMEIAGLKTTTGHDAGTSEVTGPAVKDSGYHTATMDNGDKFTVWFSGKGMMNKDQSGTFEGTWKFVSATGKLKGIKGGGTYKGTSAADGTSDVDVDGEYTIAPAAPAKKATKKSM